MDRDYYITILVSVIPLVCLILPHFSWEISVPENDIASLTSSVNVRMNEGEYISDLLLLVLVIKY